MTILSNPFQPAIDALEKDVTELERQWNALVSTINLLRGKAGLPPRPGNGMAHSDQGSETGGAAARVSLSHDTFFGKRMGTAAREYLEMRKAAGDGPAKPREVLEALKAGGFQFEAKDENVSLVSLRAMMRKNTVTFIRLPNGTYGLAAWYPNAKKKRFAIGATTGVTDHTSEPDDEEEFTDSEPDEDAAFEAARNAVAAT